MIFRELVERALYENLNIDENLCYIWMGDIDPKIGYGRIMIQGKRYHVHRLSAYLYLGLNLDNPKEFSCHKPECPSRACWKPDHLYVGDNKSNQLDEHAMCKRGHLMSEDNIIYHKRSNGEYFRECRACRHLRYQNKIVKISG